MVEKRKYWGNREEQLCLQWIDAKTERQQVETYNQLLPKLNYMADRILNKYYTYNYSDHDDLIQLAVTKVFLTLLSHHDVNRNTTFYSFCGTVIKNKLNDEMFPKYPSSSELHPKHDYLKFEDLEFNIEEVLPDIEDTFIAEFTENILARLKAIKSKYDKEYQLIYDKYNKSIYASKLNEVLIAEQKTIFIGYCIEYLLKFGIDNLSWNSMCEYVQNNTGWVDYHIERAGRSIFGVGTEPRRLQRQMDSIGFKDNQPNLIIDDDYPPNIPISTIRGQQNRRKKLYNGYDFF